jgi:hypothetical protein
MLQQDGQRIQFSIQQLKVPFPSKPGSRSCRKNLTILIPVTDWTQLVAAGGEPIGLRLQCLKDLPGQIGNIYSGSACSNLPELLLQATQFLQDSFRPLWRTLRRIADGVGARPRHLLPRRRYPWLRFRIR